MREAVNRARDLQNTPPNDMTPRALGRRGARARREHGVTVEVEGREEIEARGMGALRGGRAGQPTRSRAHHAALRAGAGREGPLLGLVGKAVTFDTGGISIKPAEKMAEMKFDMSGGAAVLGAVGAIAAARAADPRRRPSSARPRTCRAAARCARRRRAACNGTTIEVVNTDAEGRLVLADCLAHAVMLGAERLVDVATLTGAIVTALGVTHAG